MLTNRSLKPPKSRRKSKNPPRKGTTLYFKRMVNTIEDELLRDETNFKLFMAMYYNQ
jgi:hypothetical protein